MSMRDLFKTGSSKKQLFEKQLLIKAITGIYFKVRP